MNQFVIPILLLILLLVSFLFSKWKQRKNIQDKQKEYHVELSDVIQKEYFDEYEKEKRAMKIEVNPKNWTITKDIHFYYETYI